MKMIRPPKANKDLFNSLLKGEKHDPRGHITNVEVDGDGFFAADCRAKKLLTNPHTEIPNKVQEDLKKVMKIFNRRVIESKKHKKLKMPTQRSKKKLDSAKSNNLEIDASIDAVPEVSLSEPISPNNKFVTLLSPCYGPLKKLTKNPEETEFRYIFKKYYKELPVFQPRISKDRLPSTIEPVINEPSSLEPIRKHKPPHHIVNKSSTENKAKDEKDNKHEWKQIEGVDIVDRLIEILCEFQEESHQKNINSSNNLHSTISPAATAPVGIGVSAVGGSNGGVPTISRPASAMQSQISSNINLHLGTHGNTNIVSIESMFSAGKHLPTTITRPTSSSSTPNKPPLPVLTHSQRPKSALPSVSHDHLEVRKAVVQRAILTRTAPAKSWTIPDEYK